MTTVAKLRDILDDYDDETDVKFLLVQAHTNLQYDVGYVEADDGERAYLRLTNEARAEV